MRHYWLEAELSQEQWDLSVYGLTPFFVEKKGLSRKYSYEPTGNYEFPVSGESESQSNLSGTMIFIGTGIHNSEDQVLRFRKFITKNTTAKNTSYNSAPFTMFQDNYQGENTIRKLRLYSQEAGREPRYCYVMISAFQRQEKTGSDVKYTITFNMCSLWLIKRKKIFNNDAKVTLDIRGELEPVLGIGVTTSDTSSSNIFIMPTIDLVSIMTIIIPQPGQSLIGYARGKVLIGEVFDEFVATKSYWASGVEYYGSAWSSITSASDDLMIKYVISFGEHEAYMKKSSSSSSGVHWNGFFFWNEKYFED